MAELHRGAGRHLLESPLFDDQETTPLDTGAESPRVSATVRDTEQLRRWLLGFGGKVEVAAPAAVRRDVASRVRAAAKRYLKRRR